MSEENILKKLDDHGKQIDMIAQRVVSHDERLERIEENMATKDDLSQVYQTLDEILGVVKKTDQEITMMNSRVSRTEDQVEINTNDITKMKPMIGLA